VPVRLAYSNDMIILNNHTLSRTDPNKEGRFQTQIRHNLTPPVTVHNGFLLIASNLLPLSCGVWILCFNVCISKRSHQVSGGFAIMAKKGTPKGTFLRN